MKNATNYIRKGKAIHLDFCGGAGELYQQCGSINKAKKLSRHLQLGGDKVTCWKPECEAAAV